MPYDKDGKYYRKPVVPEKTGKSVDDILNNANRNANIFVTFVLVGIVVGIAGGCVAILNYEYEPKRNPNLEGTVQDFDVCVKKQKRKGLSTDKCWDML